MAATPAKNTASAKRWHTLYGDPIAIHESNGDAPKGRLGLYVKGGPAYKLGELAVREVKIQTLEKKEERRERFPRRAAADLF